ncbi:hypothetical protein RclHR1_06140008 [Rhizophagus clarus]|uniref:Uncharacterized protein n=1 Tax=Rhizophagus clarus TaxID=94130 RepID=A0A2Z6RQW2_9GLOM|nr:hypothetical protein RclHR1_06140008 [Rhizophagus clarus]GES95825.1 hypothetical protein GLOIN_2v1691179 [Rhizophagus clarus]
MKSDDKLNIEVLNVLFKILQKYKFETPVPDDTIEIIKEYIDSRRINVETFFSKNEKFYEIGWDQDNLLQDLLSSSLKLYESHIKDFERIHIETKRKWFLDKMKNGGINSELEILTDIVLNQEKYLPGFKYFYEFDIFHNDGLRSGDLLFVSEVGVLAVIGVKHLNKFTYIDKKSIKNQIRDYKSFANKRFNNKFAVIIGLYASYNRNNKIMLNPIDSFDKMIMKKVKEIMKKHDAIRGKSSNMESDSTYSNSEEEISDSDDDVVIDDNSSQNIFFDFLKSIFKYLRFIIFILILEFIYKNYYLKKGEN